MRRLRLRMLLRGRFALLPFFLGFLQRVDKLLQALRFGGETRHVLAFVRRHGDDVSLEVLRGRGQIQVSIVLAR